MTARQRLCIAACLAFLGATACNVGGSVPGQLRKLSSGKTVRILSVGRMYFSQSGPAMSLKYVSWLKPSDHAALRKEAEEGWTDFKADVERAGVGSAIVSANTPAHGAIVQRSEGFNFVYSKQANGSWKCQDDK